ncbi:MULTISPECIES: S9 family peptidase [Alistipes]|uniref:alpha/beta hydrolase family protein n=2 Tax=Rikenellaceae TaxID=171550 RepID=UPI001B384C04|nr:MULTISPECIES: alpha/beta fold hydrolase [Alistipes]MBQ4903539.1 alpha/beta fold hydrolase [Alistipes sp. Marseille-P2263]MCI2259295.1 alpha/beta hydrolase [Alistipes dispar]
MKSFVILLIALFSGIGNCHAIIPDTVYIRKPESMGLIYKNLEVITNDGYKIETWFFPAQSPLSEGELRDLNGNRRTYETQDETKRPTIIVCNGDAGNMSYFQLYLAKSWTSRGFNVVTFDWRGFGKSSPFAMDRNYLCYTEMLEDYRAVVRTTSEQEEVLNGAIAVVGWSTGAYLSMITAYTDDLVNAFVGRSLPTDFDDFIPLVMKYKNKTRNELLVPEDFPTELMPVHIAPEFGKPLFLIVGENDFRTPVWMSRKIIESVPGTTPKELMIVENAAHGGKEDPILIAFDDFIKRTSDFLMDNLRPLHGKQPSATE